MVSPDCVRSEAERLLELTQSQVTRPCMLPFILFRGLLLLLFVVILLVFE